MWYITHKEIMQFKDISGKKINRWLIKHRTSKPGEGRVKFLAVCDCGTEKEVIGSQVSTGGSKSCGCLKLERQLERNIKHNMSNSSFYFMWATMRQRCSNKKSKGYKNYGGRGIKVDPRWGDFMNFKEDMYESYKEHKERNESTQIDRVNNNKDYSKRNCRWVTHKENQQNKRK